MNAPEPEYLPLKAAAYRFGLEYAQLYALVRSGEIPARNVAPNGGTRWQVRTADVRKWIESRESAA